MRISMSKCKKRLAILWFFSSIFLFLILFFQTIFGRFDSRSNEAWSWFLPTIMPTLSLIIGVMVMDTLGKGIEIKRADMFFFRLTYLLSVAYILIVASTILIQPFSTMPLLDLMKQSNLWLGPFQGLVSASLGAFFVKREQ
jgi:hypothetical protein